MYIVVLITCPDTKEAEKISNILLKDRLAACVNIVPDLKSHFWWAGRLHNAEEVLLIVKTKEKLLKEVVGIVKKHHQYENPEVIALPIIGGSKEYTRWIDEETKI